jgi:hypothetical protein
LLNGPLVHIPQGSQRTLGNFGSGWMVMCSDKIWCVCLKKGESMSGEWWTDSIIISPVLLWGVLIQISIMNHYSPPGRLSICHFVLSDWEIVSSFASVPPINFFSLLPQAESLFTEWFGSRKDFLILQIDKLRFKVSALSRVTQEVSRCGIWSQVSWFYPTMWT